MLPEDILSAGPDLVHAVAGPDTTHANDVPEVEVDPQAPVTHAAAVASDLDDVEEDITESFDEEAVTETLMDTPVDGSGKEVTIPFEDMSLETALAKLKEAYQTITSGGEHTRAVLAGLHRMHPRANSFPEEGIQGYKFVAVHGSNSDPGCLNALMTYLENTMSAYTQLDSPTVLLAIDMRCHGEADRFLEIMVEWLTLVSPPESAETMTQASADSLSDIRSAIEPPTTVSE